MGLTFKDYLERHNNKQQVKTFNGLFKERIYRIPDKTCSSKYLMELLDVKSFIEKQVFKDAFMDYFEIKLNMRGI